MAGPALDPRHVLELASDGYLLADTSGRVLDVNAAYCRILGYTREEVLAANIRDLEASLDPQAIEHAIRSFVDHGVARFETRHRHKQGHAVDFDVSIVVLEVEGEQLVAAFLRDISARVRAEDRRSALESRIRQAQRLEAVGRLAGGIAHDFNNLLTPILGWVDVALEELPPSGAARDALSSIRDAAERARTLTRQILAFSRQEPRQPRPVSLGALVESFLSLLRRTLREDVRIEFARDPAPDTIEADVTQLEQVLLNLALNAEDAMPQGGVLRIRTDVTRSPAGAPVVVLTVADEGCGMDERTARRVFEPFFTTKGRGQGTGLGLASAYGILKQHGASIDLRTAPGDGAEFRIAFPAAPAADPGAETSASPPPAGGDETILLVEDDDAVRAVVRRMLEQAGYRVLDAADADQALARIEDPDQRIDLLLADVVLPGTDAKRLFDRARRVRGDLAAVFMSGYTDDVVLAHGLEGEREMLLAKPFTKDALLAHVRAALDERRR